MFVVRYIAALQSKGFRVDHVVTSFCRGVGHEAWRRGVALLSRPAMYVIRHQFDNPSPKDIA